MVGQVDTIKANNFLNRNLYIACLDENLDKLGEIYHTDDYVYMVKSMAACPECGCLISCHNTNELTNESGNCLIKVSKETIVGIEEAHDAGFAVAIAYPNPGNNTLNIRTALQNSCVELYDINGKLICKQEISDVVTSISTENLPSGVYVWKERSLDNIGMTAESGKWVKE